LAQPRRYTALRSKTQDDPTDYHRKERKKKKRKGEAEPLHLPCIGGRTDNYGQTSKEWFDIQRREVVKEREQLERKIARMDEVNAARFELEVRVNHARETEAEQALQQPAANDFAGRLEQLKQKQIKHKATLEEQMKMIQSGGSKQRKKRVKPVTPAAPPCSGGTSSEDAVETSRSVEIFLDELFTEVGQEQPPDNPAAVSDSSIKNFSPQQRVPHPPRRPRENSAKARAGTNKQAITKMRTRLHAQQVAAKQAKWEARAAKKEAAVARKLLEQMEKEKEAAVEAKKKAVVALKRRADRELKEAKRQAAEEAQKELELAKQQAQDARNETEQMRMQLATHNGQKPDTDTGQRQANEDRRQAREAVPVAVPPSLSASLIISEPVATAQAVPAAPAPTPVAPAPVAPAPASVAPAPVVPAPAPSVSDTASSEEAVNAVLDELFFDSTQEVLSEPQDARRVNAPKAGVSLRKSLKKIRNSFKMTKGKGQ
jgi:hypothetical protein